MIRLVLRVAAVLLVVTAVILWQTGSEVWGVIKVRSDLEDRHSNGKRHTPSTQSFLRGEHMLEGVVGVRVAIDKGASATVELQHPKMEFSVVNLPIDQLVPRLHYTPKSPPDDFDALNLLLAEYSRNGISVPRGAAGDSMAHFETSLQEERPYRLGGDYQFQANPDFRPIRFAVINNCLAPGLWELSAQDRSGEIYHSWFDVSEAGYIDLVARTNDLPRDFVAEAVKWRLQEVAIDFERLRRDARPVGRAAATVRSDEESGYSSQDSRRKLAAGFATVERDGEQAVPKKLADLTASPVQLSSFIAPGKYSLKERRKFDFQFLRGIRGVDVYQTTALTHYNWRAAKQQATPDCLELHLDLGEWVVVLGNLPMHLLVPQEDFGIWGFGAGVLPSSDFAERRKFLIEAGPPPPFSYLCKKQGDKLIAVNSHDKGVEQVFIRTHVQDAKPHWEITVTSYERIVDLVKYQVEIPKSLVAPLKRAAANYAAPLYRTYRDDNVR